MRIEKCGATRERGVKGRVMVCDLRKGHTMQHYHLPPDGRGWYTWPKELPEVRPEE